VNPEPVDRRAQLLIGVVGLLLAAAGVTEYTDGIVRYVAGVVDGISWLDLWKPAFDPPPMNTYTYRPLTVVSVKLGLLITDRNTMAMAVLHGLTIPWLGLAAHRFLRVHGMAKVALPAALSTMALPSMLFSGWIPVESDIMGAAFLCEAGWALQRWRATGARRTLIFFAVMAFGAATTKETSAAAGFGYLAAFAWAYRKEAFKRYAAVAFTYGVVLFILIIPFLMAKAMKPHNFNVASDEFTMARAWYLIVHNLAQLFYILSSAGALLLAVRGRLRLPVLLLLAVVVLAAPPLRVYNHYESVIIDQVDYVALTMVIALGALTWIFLRSGSPEEVTCTGAVLFLFGVLAVAPVLALQSRPDVSARLYAPVAPILHGLAWSGAALLVADARERPRWVRPIAWLVAGSFALFPLGAASNGVQLFRARMAVELVAKTALAERLKQPGITCPFVIVVNRDHELAVEELQALEVDWTQCSELFVPNLVHLDPSDSDLESWKIQGHTYSLTPSDNDGMAQKLLDGEALERCTYLYLQTPKAMMDTSDYQRFAGDFAWAFNNLPEFDEEVYRQQVEIQYREHIAYQKLFGRAGAGEVLVEEPFTVFPLNPNEALQRLFRGIPVIETYSYEGRTLFFENCLTISNE